MGQQVQTLFWNSVEMPPAEVWGSWSGPGLVCMDFSKLAYVPSRAPWTARKPTQCGASESKSRRVFRRSRVGIGGYVLHGGLTMLPLEKVQKVNRPRRMCAAVCVSPFVCRPASGGTGFFFPRAALPALCENNENKKSAKDLAMHRHRQRGTYDKADTFMGSGVEVNEKPNRTSDQVFSDCKSKKQWPTTRQSHKKNRDEEWER